MHIDTPACMSLWSVRSCCVLVCRKTKAVATETANTLSHAITHQSTVINQQQQQQQQLQQQQLQQLKRQQQQQLQMQYMQQQQQQQQQQQKKVPACADVHYHMLQCVAVLDSVFRPIAEQGALQYATVCGSALQCISAHCNPRCRAVCCRVLPCVTVCCSVLQPVAELCALWCLLAVSACLPVYNTDRVLASIHRSRARCHPIQGEYWIPDSCLKRDTNHRVLLRKITYKDKAPYVFSPPYSHPIVKPYSNFSNSSDSTDRMLQYVAVCRSVLQRVAAPVGLTIADSRHSTGRIARYRSR